MGHQKACHQIITDLFTPQTIVQDEVRREIIRWYFRFEIFSGTMSGEEVQLSRAWYEAAKQYYTHEVRDNPHDIGAKFEEFFATTRILAYDFTILTTPKLRSQMTAQDFEGQSQVLIDRVDAFSRELQSFKPHEAAYFEHMPIDRFYDELPSIIDHEQDISYKGEYFTMNFVLLDFWTVELMIRQQISQADPNTLAYTALQVRRMVEQMQHHREAPKGALLACQAGVGIATLFLKTTDHIEWARHTLNAIEQSGYIYPTALRERMSGLWDIDVRQAWLSEDDSSQAALQNLREFIDWRASKTSTSLDVQLRHMSGIFRSLYTDAREGHVSET